MDEDRSAKVLVVDDETALLESYKALLSTRYEVTTASTGEKAIERLDSQTDVVLLDRRMPEQSGEEILAEIRASDTEQQVVFCSAVVPDTDIIPLEVDAYLQKPVGPEELFETIDWQCSVATHSTALQEYAALEAKRAAIEAANSNRTTPGDEYQTLLDQIEQKEQSVDVAEMDHIPA